MVHIPFGFYIEQDTTNATNATNRINGTNGIYAIYILKRKVHTNRSTLDKYTANRRER